MDRFPPPQSISPLIKWPGGKRALVPEIIRHLPDRFATYYEPFFGGGALFFALPVLRAVLSDLNEELINCYQCVKDHPAQLIALLRKRTNSEAEYYKIRESQPRKELMRAARLMYLTRLSFNGIHRVNLSGQFNVPYGQKTHLETVDERAVIAASKRLESVQLLAGDFQSITDKAQIGDLIYFDPPYTVAHANNGFVKYNERIFSWADQVRLSLHAGELAARGCHVIVSNADHPSVTGLYRNAKRIVVERNSIISASSEHRRRVTESLFVLRGMPT